jgi:hypothetical protein
LTFLLAVFDFLAALVAAISLSDSNITAYAFTTGIMATTFSRFDPEAHLTKQGWKGKGTGELTRATRQPRADPLVQHSSRATRLGLYL